MKTKKCICCNSRYKETLSHCPKCNAVNRGLGNMNEISEAIRNFNTK